MYWPEFAVTTQVDPFGGLRRLQRDINRLFEAGNPGEAESYPAVNLWSNAEQVTLTAELPGVDPKDIDISVQGDAVTLQGERKVDEPTDDVVCHRQERGAGKFVRSFRLPYEVDGTRVSARYARGVLTVSLPRTESSKPKKIAISAE